jgi:NifU-like protein involved in Fe-S cluster formation
MPPVSSALYSRDILRLAASIPCLGRLAAPEGRAERSSRLCGSRVAVDVVLDGEGRIATVGLAVKACALGQASAALMAQHAPGRSQAEIEQGRDALAGYLAGERADPGAWPGLTVFETARAFPARHAAILLPFDAAAAAAAAALAGAEA